MNTVYEFTDKEITCLEHHRDMQDDSRLKVRFFALLLLAKTSNVILVANVFGKSLKSVDNWYHQLKTKGIDSLNSFQYKPKTTYLKESQIEQLIKWVKETNPAKTKEVSSYIKEQFNVTYSIEAVRQLLKKKGLKVLRPKVIPGKPPTEEEQKEFIQKYENMKSSSEPGTVFLFGDGMHLHHQNIPGLCWGDPKEPPILKTNTGRKRLNILGAYNPQLHSFVHLTGEENCDAVRAKLFFELILKAYANAPKIVLFLDNARYFKNEEIVNKWLKDNPRLQIEFLPAYAPNLNLIERFWRFVKEHLVRNTYYEKYQTFRATVFQFLNHIDKHVDELKTLMVEKFQIVKTS